MIQTLKNAHLVDYKGLLINRYKELELDESSVMILLVILTLDQQGVKTITPNMIGRYMNFEIHKIDKALVELIKHGFLGIQGSNLKLDALYDRILTSDSSIPKEEEMVKSGNLVEIIEQEFGRALSPMEIETIREWNQMGYAKDMILNAVRESTLRNIHSLRYIASILQSWTSQGVTQRKPRKAPTQTTRSNIENYDWLEEE